MNTKESYDIIFAIHEQNGDTSFATYFTELEKSIERFDDYNKWVADIDLNRTDLSQDFKWEVECFSESFRALFALKDSSTV